MVEVASNGVILREEEIELDLGLSIGGSFKRPEKLKPIKNEAVQCQQITDTRSDGFDSDPRENQTVVGECDRESVVGDLMTKREIHALRRQEAKRKREEKQKKRGLYRAKAGELQNGDAKMWSKPQELETKESNFETEERALKRNRVEDTGPENHGMKNVNLNLGTEHNLIPVVPVPYPYPYLRPPVQYVPYTNGGFVYPCINVMPYWAGGRSERNSGQAVGSMSFGPFAVGQNVGSGCDSEQNSNGGRKTVSSRSYSPMCSSSAVSDYRSSSQEGSSSSETRSQSNQSQPDQPRTNWSLPNKSECQLRSLKSAPSINKPTNHIERTVSLNVTGSSPLKPKSHVQSYLKDPLSTADNSTASPSEVESSSLCLPQMPCVSTTGNGPNGKTINGFLYRYTKSEVCIICVCHGSSFSPAEFVQHAGGTDVSHPLRHITVIPSSFG